MAQKRLSTRERQALLFGKKPVKPLIMPPPARLPEDANLPKDESTDVSKYIKLPEDNRAPTMRFRPGARYFRFRSRHTPNAPWTVSPGRWKRLDRVAAAAKDAKSLDPRLEVQIYPVQG